MATIGQALTIPDNGWKRCNGSEINITYEGKWDYAEDPLYFDGDRYSTMCVNDSLKFNFTGSKLRIIGAYNSIDSGNIEVRIDNRVFNISTYGSSLVPQALIFDESGLPNSEHCVIITNLQDGKYCTIDAIDIDATGQLKPYEPLQPQKSESILLRIVMVDSSEREYKVNTEKTQEFVDWCNNIADKNNMTFVFSKSIGITGTMEYLMRDKIISFEIVPLE